MRARGTTACERVAGLREQLRDCGLVAKPESTLMCSYMRHSRGGKSCENESRRAWTVGVQWPRDVEHDWS